MSPLLFLIHKNSLLYYTKSTDMIYIDNSTTAQVVYVPASEKKVEGSLTFMLMSTVNRQEALSVSVTQEGQSDLYYKFKLTLTNKMQEGEYEYILKQNNDILDCGLAIVGSSSPKTEYNSVIQYEQYESE